LSFLKAAQTQNAEAGKFPPRRCIRRKVYAAL
jgi:hypothetical protein